MQLGIAVIQDAHLVSKCDSPPKPTWTHYFVLYHCFVWHDISAGSLHPTSSKLSLQMPSSDWPTCVSCEYTLQRIQAIFCMNTCISWLIQFCEYSRVRKEKAKCAAILIVDIQPMPTCQCSYLIKFSSTALCAWICRDLHFNMLPALPPGIFDGLHSLNEMWVQIPAFWHV